MSLGRGDEPKLFQTEDFSWTSARHVRPTMLVFQELEGLTEAFERMSAGMPGPMKTEASSLG